MLRHDGQPWKPLGRRYPMGLKGADSTHCRREKGMVQLVCNSPLAGALRTRPSRCLWTTGLALGIPRMSGKRQDRERLVTRKALLCHLLVECDKEKLTFNNSKRQNTVSIVERSGSGVELRTLDYENPGSNPGCGVKTLGKFFHSPLLQFSQLNKNE